MMSTSILQYLKDLRQDPRFKLLVEELRQEIPVHSQLLYKDYKDQSDPSDKQVSSWIFNSGRIMQGNLLLAYLTGETDEGPNG